MEQFGNHCSTTVATGGYTSGSGVLNVASTASPWPSTGTFTVVLRNSSLTILRVTAINSSTQWAVTAESSDANASAGTTVLGTILSAAAMSQVKTDTAPTIQIGSYASIPSSGMKAGDIYNCSDSVFNAIYNGSAWQYQLFGRGTAFNKPDGVVGQTTTLNGGINNSVTSLTVNSQFGSMPATPFFIMIGTEQIKVTAASTTTWTIARGDGGTTAASHSNGDTISEMVFSWNEFFTNCSYTQFPGYFTMQSSSSRGDGQDWCTLLKTPLKYSAPWTVIICMSPLMAQLANYFEFGIACWTASSASNAVILGSQATPLSFVNGFYTYSGGNYWTSPSFASGNSNQYPAGTSSITTPSPLSPWWYKWVDDGTNWKGYLSTDGVGYFQLCQVTRNTYITPTHIGPFFGNRSVTGGVSVFAVQQFSGVV